MYLHARRKLGFLLRIEGSELLRFARYADGLQHCGAVTRDLALQWAQDTDATPLYRARRLEIVRCFTKYQIAFEPRTEIPEAGILGPAHRRMPPYIFSPSEIERLVKAARCLPSPRGLRGETYASLIGLIACTGLRISEALHLRRADTDLEVGVLSIRESKFRKSRLVPLHSSATIKLQRYLDQREAVTPRAGPTLFVSEGGDPLPDRTVHGVIRRLIDGIVGDEVFGRRPRIHDLRHTFACHRLLQWYRDGVDVDQRVAALSTYLGHAKVSDTYWYVTAVPELMEIAAARFEHFGRDTERR